MPFKKPTFNVNIQPQFGSCLGPSGSASPRGAGQSLRVPRCHRGCRGPRDILPGPPGREAQESSWERFLASKLHCLDSSCIAHSFFPWCISGVGSKGSQKSQLRAVPSHSAPLSIPPQMLHLPPAPPPAPLLPIKPLDSMIP